MELANQKKNNILSHNDCMYLPSSHGLSFNGQDRTRVKVSRTGRRIPNDFSPFNNHSQTANQIFQTAKDAVFNPPRKFSAKLHFSQKNIKIFQEIIKRLVALKRRSSFRLCYSAEDSSTEYQFGSGRRCLEFSVVSRKNIKTNIKLDLELDSTIRKII